jgi:hypothetical protein
MPGRIALRFVVSIVARPFRLRIFYTPRAAARNGKAVFYTKLMEETPAFML